MGEYQQTARSEDMATTSTAVATVSSQVQEDRVAVITLRPTSTKKEARKKVVWTEDTVDNEHMNKKKSKCCCIYEKPRRFDESDSDSSEDECEHCYGHVEKRHRPRAHAHAALSIGETPEPAPEPPGAPPLQPPAPPDEAPPTS